MGHRPFLYLCPGCHKSKRNQNCEYVCEPCGKELRELSSLYTRIVTKHKSLRGKGMAEVLTRLWTWYEKQNGIEPKKEEPIDPVADAKYF